jgi:non-heme chloroperoxidase
VAYDRRGFGRSDKPESGYDYDTLADDLQRVLDQFSANGVLQVSEAQRGAALALCHQSAPHAALACMDAFSTTDFRGDLKKVTVPTLVIHGDADAIVPIEASGLRAHRAVHVSQLVRIAGAPHGVNVSHAPVFNEALLAFLQR